MSTVPAFPKSRQAILVETLHVPVGVSNIIEKFIESFPVNPPCELEWREAHMLVEVLTNPKNKDYVLAETLQLATSPTLTQSSREINLFFFHIRHNYNWNPAITLLRDFGSTDEEFHRASWYALPWTIHVLRPCSICTKYIGVRHECRP